MKFAEAGYDFCQLLPAFFHSPVWWIWQLRRLRADPTMAYLHCVQCCLVCGGSGAAAAAPFFIVL